jgi:hypothetical protein
MELVVGLVEVSRTKIKLKSSYKEFEAGRVYS